MPYGCISRVRCSHRRSRVGVGVTSLDQRGVCRSGLLGRDGLFANRRAVKLLGGPAERCRKNNRENSNRDLHFKSAAFPHGLFHTCVHVWSLATRTTARAGSPGVSSTATRLPTTLGPSTWKLMAT